MGLFIIKHCIPMKIISFDIGIKNLAYCVLSIEPSQPLTIVDWNVINLLSPASTTSTHTYLCTCLVPSRKKKTPSSAVSGTATNILECGKKAKWEKNGGYYCETHAKSSTEFLIPKKEHTMTFLKKKKVADLHALAQTNTTGLTKDKLLEHLVSRYTDLCFKECGGEHNIPKVSASAIDLITVGRAIKSKLDGVVSFGGATHILIENQISTIATRMKTVQGMLSQYFIMRSDTQDAQIEFVSSANKLKGLVSATSLAPKSGVEDGEESKTVATSINPQYKQHKKDGVDCCARFLAMNEPLGNWSSFFGAKPSPHFAKRDDLADCFLQGIWYLKSQKIICYADNLKINSVLLS